MLSLIGIAVSILVIMFLAFKKVPLYVYAIFCAIIVAAFDGTNPYTAISTDFVRGCGEYFENNILLFASSAVFAAFMDASGAARCIAIKIARLAKKTRNSKLSALLVMALVEIILTAGGINIFVVIFLLVSINRAMFEELDIPWNLFLVNCWASSTLTIWALPGMPSIQNLIPTTYLGTTAMAGAGLGFFMAIEITILCLLYLIFCLKCSERRNEHFLPQGAAVTEKAVEVDVTEAEKINLLVALIPSICVLIAMNGFSLPAVVSLLIGCAVSYVLFFKRIKQPTHVIARGITDGLMVLIPVCFMTGYGAVVATTSSFELIIGALQSIPGPEVLQVFIAANVSACVCGSVSGGLGIMFTTMGKYLSTMSLSPEIIHRVAVAGASGLDSMPYAASIHSLMRVSSIEFEWNSYKYIFMINLVLTLIVGISGVALVSLGIFV